jgi:hypothetical protein
VPASEDHYSLTTFKFSRVSRFDRFFINNSCTAIVTISALHVKQRSKKRKKRPSVDGVRALG